MKRLGLSLLFLSVLPVAAGDLVIDNKSYTFEEIISKTQFKYEPGKGQAYSNPFNLKTAKIILIAGTSRKGVAERNKESFWYVLLPPLIVQFEPEGEIPPFYELKFFLVPVTQTPYGTISFKVNVADPGKPGLPYDIFDAFIRSMEKRRNLREYTDQPAAVELTGTLDLSGIVQPKSAVYKGAQIDYTFLPTQVEVLDSKP